MPFLEAHYYSTGHRINLLRLYQVNMELRRYAEACQNALELAEKQYPDIEEAQRMLRESEIKKLETN